MKMFKVVLVFLFLYSTTFAAKINGSIGFLHEQSNSNSLDGVFIEINSQKIGGYFSATGMAKREPRIVDRNSFIKIKALSINNVDFGFTYLIKKRFGLLGHIGFQNETYQSFVAYHPYLCRKKPMDDDDPEGRDSPEIWSKYYFSYGTGCFFYILSDYITVHLKYTHVFKLNSDYMGIGFGIHIFSKGEG